MLFKMPGEQSVREQVLDICKKLFDGHICFTQNCEDEEYDFMPQGIPKAMLIVEFDSCTRSLNKIRNGYNSNEIVRAWRYSNNSLEEIQIDKEPKLSTDRHKNYDEVYARYAFSIEKKIVYLNVFYAPLSASGYVFHILEKEGMLSLSEAEWEWLS